VEKDVPRDSGGMRYEDQTALDSKGAPEKKGLWAQERRKVSLENGTRKTESLRNGGMAMRAPHCERKMRLKVDAGTGRIEEAKRGGKNPASKEDI